MYLEEDDILVIQNYFVGKPVLRAYLFGSYSRGEAEESSDIDILVDLDYSQHIGFGFVQMKLDLEEQLKRSVDLISCVSHRLRPFIGRDKWLIYDSGELSGPPCGGQDF